MFFDDPEKMVRGLVNERRSHVVHKHVLVRVKACVKVSVSVGVRVRLCMHRSTRLMERSIRSSRRSLPRFMVHWKDVSG